MQNRAAYLSNDYRFSGNSGSRLGGYSARGVTPLHFGLPGTRQVTVEVTFMSVSGRKVQRLEKVSIPTYNGRTLVIRRAS